MPNYGNPTQTVIDIITKADPSAIQQFQREIQATATYMGALEATMRASGATSVQIASALQGLGNDMARFQSYVNAANSTFGLTQAQANGAMQAVQGFSRGLEDIVLTGGNVASALNNIPQLTMGIAQAFGASSIAVAGWTAGISLAGSGALLLYQNWGYLMDAMGTGRIATESEEMAALAKATERTYTEERRLQEYREKQAAGKALLRAKTEEEKAQEKAVKEALVGNAHDRVVRGLADSAPDFLEAGNDDARRAADAMREREESLRETLIPGAGGATRQRSPQEYAEVLAADPVLAELRGKYHEALKGAAHDLLSDATTNPGALDMVIRRMESARSAFPAGVSEKLAAATPGGQAEAKELEAELHAASKAVGDFAHALTREAHAAMSDPALFGSQRTDALQAIMGRLDRSGYVGQDVGRAREQIEDMIGRAKSQAARDLSAAENQAEADVKKLSGQMAQDLARELHRIVRDTRDPNQRIAGLMDLGGMVGRADLAADDREKLVQRLMDTLATAQGQRGRGEAAAEKKADAADKKADAAAQRQANKLDDPLIARLEWEMAENARRVAAGAVVAQTPEEFELHRQMGNSPAMSPELLRGWQQQRVGFDLAQAGQDPRLAGRIVGNAEKDVQQRMVGLSSRTARTGDQLADNQLLLGSLVEELAGQVMQSEAKAAHVGARLSQLQAGLRRNNSGRFPAMQPAIQGVR